MTLLEEIRDGFAAMASNGALKINSLAEEHTAYIIRIPDGYGVALPVSEDVEVAENFNSCKFRTGMLSIGGVSSNYLMLVSAFYNREKVLEAYKTAVDEKYRFFSFGDAMFIV